MLIKENIPEKSDTIEFMKQLLCAPIFKTNEENEESCCNCKCCGKCFGISILIFLWTITSIILGVVGIFILGLSFGFQALCCVYHCCYHICCTTEVHDYDKGDHILRVTTHYEGRERQNAEDAVEHAELLGMCGVGGVYCSFNLISWGYKKICGLID